MRNLVFGGLLLALGTTAAHAADLDYRHAPPPPYGPGPVDRFGPTDAPRPPDELADPDDEPDWRAGREDCPVRPTPWGPQPACR